MTTFVTRDTWDVEHLDEASKAQIERMMRAPGNAGVIIHAINVLADQIAAIPKNGRNMTTIEGNIALFRRAIDELEAQADSD